jgi:hypothetical protein
LNLLAEGIGIRHEQGWGRPLRGVERIRYVDDDFAREVRFLGHVKGLERAGAERAVEDDVGRRSGLLERSREAVAARGLGPSRRLLVACRA